MVLKTNEANGAATLSYAEAAVLAVQHEMEADARVVVLGEDVGRGGIFGQYKGLQQRFGSERVIDTPISEAAIMGAGVGMALAGLRPVVEMRVVDFALCGMDEIVNQAAKNRFMFGGQGRVPLVARMPIGIWDASAAQHSQSLEAWFAHLPGITVVCPSTAQDNYALLRASLQSGDPVVYMEHKTLWGAQGQVDPAQPAPLGKAAVRRTGGDLTIVSWSRQALVCEDACATLAGQGIHAELIDLRTIWPWDRETVLAHEASTVSRSQGQMVRRSISSAWTPCSASVAQASSHTSAWRLQLTMVRSAPARRTAAFPSGLSMAGSTCPCAPHKVLCSM